MTVGVKLWVLVGSAVGLGVNVGVFVGGRVGVDVGVPVDGMSDGVATPDWGGVCWQAEINRSRRIKADENFMTEVVFGMIPFTFQQLTGWAFPSHLHSVSHQERQL